MSIKAGDVVSVKSGGPRMTVARVYPKSETGVPDKAHVMWFDGHGSLHEDTLELVALEKDGNNS